MPKKVIEEELDESDHSDTPSTPKLVSLDIRFQTEDMNKVVDKINEIISSLK